MSNQLSAIESYLESIMEDGALGYQIVVKDLPGCIVYSRRMIVDGYDSYFDVVPRIGKECMEANPGIRCIDNPPYCFIEYHDGEYKDHDIDMELCEAVDRVGVDTPNIAFKRIPRVPEAACVLHKGPYSALRAAYAGRLQMDRRQRLCPRGQSARVLYRRHLEPGRSRRMAYGSAGPYRAPILNFHTSALSSFSCSSATAQPLKKRAKAQSAPSGSRRSPSIEPFR